MTPIEESFLNKYGPLLSLQELAELLDRSADGLRISLRSPHCKWANEINSARLKIGRRVYFRTHRVAQILSE